MIITQANLQDMDGVFALLRANHVSNVPEEEKKNGFVTTNLTVEQMTALIEKENGVTIAKDDDGKVVAFALAASWEFWAEWPLFAYMIQELDKFECEGVTLTKENSYQYGPVCIDKNVRGTGVFEKVFFASLANYADKYPYMATFINQINPRSYAAHTRKALMTEAGTFPFNNNNYYMMVCPTTPPEKR